jgi:hypothetical protein
VSPRSADEREQQPGLPLQASDFVAHYCGHVGPTGRIAASSFENYVLLVARSVDAALEKVSSESNRFKLLVSCALLPDRQQVLLIETAPTAASKAWRGNLHDAIQQIARPSVLEGPVGFVIYRSNTGTPRDTGLLPFSRWQTRIEEQGIDAALLQAASEPSRNRS